MQYSKLGRTGLDVSRVCLGAMTWGSQKTEAEAFDLSWAEELDKAVDAIHVRRPNPCP